MDSHEYTLSFAGAYNCSLIHLKCGAVIRENGWGGLIDLQSMISMTEATDVAVVIEESSV